MSDVISLAADADAGADADAAADRQRRAARALMEFRQARAYMAPPARKQQSRRLCDGDLNS